MQKKSKFKKKKKKKKIVLTNLVRVVREFVTAYLLTNSFFRIFIPVAQQTKQNRFSKKVKKSEGLPILF